MQKIYKYRSNIVHGNPIKEKDNKIKYANKEYTIIELSLELLTSCIKTIKKNPELLNKFDDALLSTFIKS